MPEPRNGHRVAGFQHGPFLLWILLTALLLSAVQQLTSTRIDQQYRQLSLALMRAMLPAQCDHDALENFVTPAQSTGVQAMQIAQCQQQGVLVRRLLVPAPVDAYHGPLQVLLTLAADGRIHEVRIEQHAEHFRPARRLLAADSGWLSGLQGASLAEAVAEAQLRSDAVSGATVSARAVQRALQQAATVLMPESSSAQAPAPAPALPLN